MNFVEAVQSNWRSLPGYVRGAICTSAGAVFGFVQLSMSEPGPHNWRSIFTHAGSVAFAAFVGYLIPNARAHQPTETPKP